MIERAVTRAETQALMRTLRDFLLYVVRWIERNYLS